MISTFSWVPNELQQLREEHAERRKQEELKQQTKQALLDRLVILDDKVIQHTKEMDDKWLYDMFTFLNKLNNRTKLYNTKIAKALNIKR